MTQGNITIGVIGAGSWGTALALLLAGKEYQVKLWGFSEKHQKQLEKDRENTKYLPGITFPDNLFISFSLEETVKDSDLILMVVPSHGYRSVFEKLAPFITPEIPVVSAVKGIENETLYTMHEIMEEKLGKNSNYKLGVISGPSFAREVADKIPTAVTVGFEDIETAKKVQQIFNTDYFRVYSSTDIQGLEISGSYKNVIAIGAGICDGLGYGLNTRAALITRGIAEITRLGIKKGAKAATFAGLSGIGDLLLTCTGDLSRNRNVGLQLGKGHSIEKIENEMFMVAEGVKTTQSIYDLARKLDVETPILDQVYAIIYKNKSANEAVKDLLSRDLKPE